MAFRSHGFGRYQAGEDDLVIVSSTYQGGGPLVIVCHGFGGVASTYAPAHLRRDLALLADAGCVVIAGALGGISTFGNDASLTATANLRTWAESAWDADISRVALIGDSMGGMGALNYHWRNTGHVRCSVIRQPVVAADSLHDRDPSGLGAAIDTAYGGGAAWDAAKADRDPSAAGPAALIAEFADDVRLFYSTNDLVILPSEVASFTALTGVRAMPLGPIGHANDSLAAALPARYEAEWIMSKLEVAA